MTITHSQTDPEQDPKEAPSILSNTILPKVKRDCVILITNIERKFEEWRLALQSYGLRVEMVPYPANEEEFKILASRPDVRYVCDEESKLWTRDRQNLCKWQHLEAVVHISRIKVYQVKNGILQVSEYEGSQDGYLDLINGGRTPEGWWDTAFRLATTHKTYQESSPKISARDSALSKFLKTDLHYKRPSLTYDHNVVMRPVDFSNSIANEIRQEKLYKLSHSGDMKITELLEGAISRGLFERIPLCRPQKHVWESNFAGFPRVSKGDPVHYSTYRFHDLMHMRLGEAVLVDQRDIVGHQIYFLSRMCSEAFTLFLADGLYVESLRRSGIEYDYTTRLAHPVLIEGLGFLDRMPEKEELLTAVKANARFFVLGDTEQLYNLSSRNQQAVDALAKYIKGYQKFSSVDAAWTVHNYQQLVTQTNQRITWWEGIQNIRKYNPYLNLLSVSEIAEKIDLDKPAANRKELESVLDKIVEESFERNLSSILDGKQSETISLSEHYRRAFTRWMSGQLLLFSTFQSATGSTECMSLIIDAMSQPISDDSQIEEYCGRVRALYEEHLSSLSAAKLITPDQELMWRDCFPHFPPYFLSYARHDPTIFNKTIDSLLPNSDKLNLSPEMHPGVALLMTDGDRFIIQRKDQKHPIKACRGAISFFGGSCDGAPNKHSHELSWVGLLRELKEEIINKDALVNEIYHHARLCGSFILPGNQFPGEYRLSLYIAHTDQDTLTRWYKNISEKDVVQEGVAELLTRDELIQACSNTDNFIASLDRVFLHALLDKGLEM